MTAEARVQYDEVVSTSEIIAPTFQFEGVPIQWNKGSWEFTNPEGEVRSIDTYSIWNPEHWPEIAQRLKDGQICGMYIMGTYGTGEIRLSPQQRSLIPEKEDVLFTKVKKRDPKQNFVAFISPEDAIDVIDIDRLPDSMKHIAIADERVRTYAGPQHNIFPVRDDGTVDPGLIKADDKTISCFWIPGHFGYEGLAKVLSKDPKHGIFGGGSLNIHGQEPCYTTDELKKEISNQPDWQEHIDFIIFDEIAEAAEIGRSQTMVRLTADNPEVVRYGSLSPQAISVRTGLDLPPFDIEHVNTGRVKKASSKTEYNQENNALIDGRVIKAMDRIERYRQFIEG